MCHEDVSQLETLPKENNDFQTDDMYNQAKSSICDFPNCTLN